MCRWSLTFRSGQRPSVQIRLASSELGRGKVPQRAARPLLTAFGLSDADQTLLPDYHPRLLTVSR